MTANTVICTFVKAFCYSNFQQSEFNSNPNIILVYAVEAACALHALLPIYSINLEN